jgi:hypothetical protein
MNGTSQRWRYPAIASRKPGLNLPMSCSLKLGQALLDALPDALVDSVEGV